MRHVPSHTSPDNSSHCRKMHPEVFGYLLVRIASRRVSRNNGGIPVRRAFLDFRQWRRLGAALRKGDLHIVSAGLDMRLHAIYKLFVAQKYLSLEVSPGRIYLDALGYKLRIALLRQAALFSETRQQSINCEPRR